MRQSMTQNKTLTPLQMLLDLERRSRRQAAELPQKIEITEMWNGIAFRIGDMQMVAPMNEVSEILDMPELTRIPNAKPWVLGIANVRGNLLPVMDLSGYLFGKSTRTHKRSRLLVVNHESINSGLLVDEVYGMRHFEKENWNKKLPTHDKVLKPYVDRCYKDEERTWLVFSIHKLAESPSFHQSGL